MLEQPHMPKRRPSPTPRMPHDKHNGKPFTPSLSSNFRSTKSPLTPRLAGTVHNSPATAKREPHVRQPSPNKEEPSPLGLNITPRTAARKSRFGTESPSTTPTAVRTAAIARTVTNTSSGKSTPSHNGLGIDTPPVPSTTPLSEISNPTKSPTPIYAAPRTLSNARSTVKDDGNDDTKFFRADQARSYHTQPHEKQHADPDTQFFYVGSPPDQPIISPRLSPAKPLNSPTGSNVDDKFFHASEARHNNQKPACKPEARARSTVGSVVAKKSPQLDSKAPRPITRSKSPAKGPSAGRPTSRGKDVPTRVQAAAPPKIDARRGSMGSNVSAAKDPQLIHRKSMSANSVASTPTRKLSAPRPIAIPTLEERLGLSTRSSDSLLIPTASPDSISPRSVSLGSGPSEIAPLTEPTNNDLDNSTTVPPTSISDQPASPSLPPSNSNDPAAQARRERKVLDLEISNSSLLAINKTLERELRKQNLELRRFRRLSRSGRLSFAPSGRNVSNSTLGTLPELGDQSDHSHSDSEDLEDEFEDDELDTFSTESSSGMASPTARARQRARDERRLVLDLSRHQQLLVDSQKLSQSIKRCLMSTDELIRDGTKALEYKVGIGDIQIGGRVLTNDEDANEVDSRGEGRQGLLSPGIEIGDWLEGGLWVSQTPLSKDAASSNGIEAIDPTEPAEQQPASIAGLDANTDTPSRLSE